MEKYSFITNNCLGSTIYSKLNKQYDNPFMGSYFQDDKQYLKFCKNFVYYISLKPVFSSPKLPIDTNNPEVPADSFPVMFLDDIEIHWIHERDYNECLNKYNRRLHRLKNKIPFFIWGDSLLHRYHLDCERIELINEFNTIKNSIYFNKDNIENWKYKSFNDRVVNNGWAQPLKWLDSSFIFKLLIDFFNSQKYSIIMPLKINETNSFKIFTEIGLPLYDKFLETEYLESFFIICPVQDIKILSKYTDRYPHIPFKFIKEDYIIHKNISDINGWLKQQIIKIAIASIITTKHYLIVDSDMYLNKKLCYEDLFQNGKVKYTFEPYQELNNKYYSTNSNWWRSSCNILDYPINDLYEDKYLMSVTPQIFITDKVKELIKYLILSYGENWQKIICDMNFSEYTLYWLFMLKKNYTHLYTLEGYPLWNHDLERNILYYHTEEEQKIIANKSVLENKSYFSVIQSYLPVNVDLMKFEIFKILKPSYDSIFLVSSTVTPTQLKFFSVEERFLQTLDTIKSIKKKFPNSLCILIEGSVLSSEHKNELIKNFDFVLEFGNDKEVLPYTRNIINIGHGEQKLLEKGTEFIQQHILSWCTSKFIFKLGARYTLSDKFDILNYDKNKYNFYEEFDNNKSLEVYTTGLYSIPVDRLNEFKLILRNVHNHLSIDTDMIEKYFYDHIPKQHVNILKILGLEGRLNYNGYFFSK
jgi:uncharacterized protein (DUF1919 family)